MISHKERQWQQQDIEILSSQMTLEWRHNGHDGVSNHQPEHCFLNRLFRRRSQKTSKLCVTGFCVGNSPVTGEFPTQMASNAEMFPFDDVIMDTSYLTLMGELWNVFCEYFRENMLVLLSYSIAFWLKLKLAWWIEHRHLEHMGVLKSSSCTSMAKKFSNKLFKIDQNVANRCSDKDKKANVWHFF